jgi:hypothetical protein
LYSWQTSGYDYNGIRTLFLGSSDVLAALGRGSMSYAAGIDNDKVGLLGRFDSVEPELFEQFSNLLALILVNFTAESAYGKSLHNL